MNKRCILLFSGGLDSILAACLVKQQNVEVFALKIHTPFLQYNNNIRINYLKNILQIPLDFFYAKEEYINLILNPKYSYGKGLNPCIDCKIYMFKKAKEYMEKLNATFIVTGEVLDQRALSQKFWQLKLIEKEAQLEQLILRPLSCKLLPLTLPEKEGIIKRELLLDIKGKSRKKQIELAKKFGIEDISTSGGCLLTDSNFVVRFKTFFKHFKNKWELEDIELLRIGKHFYIEDTKVIIGRNEQENKILKSYYKQEKFLLLEPEFSGPTALCYLSKKLSENQLKTYAFELIKKHSKVSKVSSQT